jgi:tetratricopeptide (TPR) repeat protein
MPTPAADAAASRMEEEALRLARHGSLKAATEVCHALTTRHPRFGPGWRAASTIALQMGDAAGALSCADRALALSPDDGRSLLQKAHALHAAQRSKEAVETANRARARITDDAVALESLGALYRHTGEPRQAAEIYEQVIAGRPNDWRREVQIRYALAKDYEDLGEYARSWSHLEPGARMRRQHLNYDVAEDVQTIEWIINTFADGSTTGTGFPGPEPLFILGLPRSGATRVERILGSHPTVHSAGELNHFSAALLAAVTATAGKKTLSRRELVERSAKIDFGALGRDYVKRTRPATGKTPRFIDKMPLNYLYCGLIRRALPNARIVHVIRHPLGVAYGLYKTLFKEGYPFSYDLDDIGRYYLAYRRLMDHWHATLPGAIHDLSYEQLIVDPIGETRRLLEFCRLEPHDGCLASAAQIRQTSEETALSQWRHYAGQLAKLRDQLVVAGIEVSS